ncbi:hypothetical protein [Streptomyces sp. NPDC094032]
MSFTELLLLALLLILLAVLLLIGFLATLRGLKGEQRLAAFQAFVRALRR